MKIITFNKTVNDWSNRLTSSDLYVMESEVHGIGGIVSEGDTITVLMSKVALVIPREEAITLGDELKEFAVQSGYIESLNIRLRNKNRVGEKM